ncbi:hypothetical protein TSMEX_007273 [Taenia solium]|eukprot:TsM_001134100 transcript=TsM_001134100 gene=TsM_001134100
MLLDKGGSHAITIHDVGLTPEVDGTLIARIMKLLKAVNKDNTTYRNDTVGFGNSAVHPNQLIIYRIEGGGSFVHAAGSTSICEDNFFWVYGIAFGIGSSCRLLSVLLTVSVPLSLWSRYHVRLSVCRFRSPHPPPSPVSYPISNMTCSTPASAKTIGSRLLSACQIINASIYDHKYLH